MSVEVSETVHRCGGGRPTVFGPDCRHVDTDPEVSHATARVNGVKFHYVTADEGDPLVLDHGWP
jgi:hypothetical protein